MGEREFFWMLIGANIGAAGALYYFGGWTMIDEFCKKLVRR